jgi:predicted ATPase
MRRREWHGRVAQALEQRFGDLAAREPELLAHHFAEAGIYLSRATTACRPAIRP